MMEPQFTLKVDTEKPEFGRFIMEPLEQGYGQTIGNSLRRVLLTSLPGSAVVAIKIAGVKHQFSTVAGLKEDIVEFILNVKRIRLTVPGDSPVKLSLSKKGPGEIKAGDIEVPAGVEILNPDLVLGTLSDKKSSLEVELTAGQGFGYVTADDKAANEVGLIAVDALFTPVLRVNYRVEATRVGRMTNLDRLVIEIWTDGTIVPLEALKSAVKIIMGYFGQIIDPKIIAPKDAGVHPTTSVSDEVMRMRIEELDVPTRIVNALVNGGIETVGQLMSATSEDLRKVKNLGAKSLTVVADKLKEKGLTLTI